MFDPINKVFFDLLQQRRAPPDETARLAQLRHNDDLCPMLQRRCERVLTTLERHQSLVYDVQGFTDAGTDVVVRLTADEDSRYIAFQVKSDAEAVKGVQKTLKAQWVDSQNFYSDRLMNYYILLAWNETVRKDLIRSVEQAFVGIPVVKIIEPGSLPIF